MEVVEPILINSEDSSQPQDHALEALCQVSPQASLARFSGITSNLQILHGCRLGNIGEIVLQELYLPRQKMVWMEATVREKLEFLKLMSK